MYLNLGPVNNIAELKKLTGIWKVQRHREWQRASICWGCGPKYWAITCFFPRCVFRAGIQPQSHQSWIRHPKQYLKPLSQPPVAVVELCYFILSDNTWPFNRMVNTNFIWSRPSIIELNLLCAVFQTDYNFLSFPFWFLLGYFMLLVGLYVFFMFYVEIKICIFDLTRSTFIWYIALGVI